MKLANGQDAYLCDRCGDVANGFHEDFGNFCSACAIHWHQRDSQCIPEDRELENCYEYLNRE